MDIINIPLGYLFKWVSFLVGNNYGWALILFTIVTKLLLTPLSIKQQKSTLQMQKIQPKLSEIQKKYQYDKEKLNQETLKIYQENKISPMGGCLPLLIQFPILIALYNIINRPLTYIMQLSKEQINALANALGHTGEQINQITIAAEMKTANLPVELAHLKENAINFNFFGLDLSQIPGFVMQPLFIIPVLAGITTFLLSRVTQRNASAQQSDDNPAASSMKMMNYIFPVMTFMFSISLPAGLGVYWIMSNFYQMAQYLVLPKFIKLEEEPQEVKMHYREREKRSKKK